MTNMTKLINMPTNLTGLITLLIGEKSTFDQVWSSLIHFGQIWSNLIQTKWPSDWKYQEFIKCGKMAKLGEELKIEVDFEKLANWEDFG